MGDFGWEDIHSENRRLQQTLKSLRDDYIESQTVLAAMTDALESAHNDNATLVATATKYAERIRRLEARIDELELANLELSSKIHHWVPISDSLPEESVVVITTDGRVTRTACLSYAVTGESFWMVDCDCHEGSCFYDVTHWAPLPELPKE